MDEISSIERKNERRKQQIEEISEEIPSLAGECESISAQIQSLKDEMGTELSSQLTDAERITLEHLKQVQKNLEVEIERVTQELEEASLYRQRLQSYLNDNLLERKKEIEKEEGDLFPGSRDGFQGRKQKQEDLE